MQRPNVFISRNLTAFDAYTVGTKVTERLLFMAKVNDLIDTFDFAAQRVQGQRLIQTNELVPYVSAGVGKRTKNPDDYVLREYRGNVEAFLKREKAAPVEGCSIVVYTRAAYLADPDVQKDTVESARIENSDCTHVLVAVLGFTGPKAPLSPYRLVHNLAGGNNEALTWDADTIRTKAAESKAYHDEWCVVAD